VAGVDRRRTGAEMAPGRQGVVLLIGGRKMMAVAVTTGASFEGGSPVALFQTHRRQPVSSLDVFSYDVSGDGQRFLIATKVDEANAAPLSILLNWASEMEK